VKTRGLVVLAAFLTLGLSLLYVRSRFLMVELGYTLADKQRVRSELEQEKRALTLELATLRSPSRVEKIARSQLYLGRTASRDRSVVVSQEPQP